MLYLLFVTVACLGLLTATGRGRYQAAPVTADAANTHDHPLLRRWR